MCHGEAAGTLRGSHVSYVYKGAKPLTKVRPDGGVITLRPCGTDAAYKRHLTNDEVACDQCLAAHRIVVRKWDRKRNTRPRRKLAACGTPAAYQRHLRHNEHIDMACRDANSKLARDRRAAAKKRAKA